MKDSKHANKNTNFNSDKRKYARPRPEFPKRAVITAGMPYGNKSLHFGHIGGVFVHADTYARFLKDRIGKENVIFVSGTDCYGSPIVASHKQHIDSTGDDISLEDFVRNFHKLQDKALEQYEVSPSLYGASGFGKAAKIHEEVSHEVFNFLYENGMLQKISSPQFFDELEQVILNGRQVVGKCPFEGCKSEKAYADECSLGHQYMPSELIDPVSTLSDSVPVLKEVQNWYFDLPRFKESLNDMVLCLKDDRARKSLITAIEEFIKSPEIHITRKEFEKLSSDDISFKYSDFVDIDKRPSVTFVFDTLEDRDIARGTLDCLKVRYRTGKTLVPFRLSGNSEWGIPVPEKDGLADLTFWVWPESLWAPISFTKTVLEENNPNNTTWKDWWLDKDAKVYQFIGEDNIYFYGIAEMAMLMAYHKIDVKDRDAVKAVNLPTLVSNCHLLFLDTKASSSSDIKPPMADELLAHYTSDQLRMHFLSLGLSKSSVSFNPKPYNPKADDSEPDAVLKDGNLLTNVFNRLIRSSFYTSQKYFDSTIPTLAVSEEIKSITEKAILSYEERMAKHEFHMVTYALDDLIRKLSKYYSKHMKDIDADKDLLRMEQILSDMFYAIKCTLTLLHPIAPKSTEAVKERLRLNDSLWSWDYIFEPITAHFDEGLPYKLIEIEAKHDFFKKHDSQFK